MRVKILLMILLLFFIQSCKSEEKKMYKIAKMDMLDLSESKESSMSFQPKLIKRAELTIQSLQIENTKNSIINLMMQFKGNLLSENLNKDEYSESYNLNLKIDATKFDEFIKSIEKSKVKITHKNSYVQDITDSYIETEVSLENRKKLEQRYLELLKQTRNLNEVLEIEEKLTKVREEIETAAKQKIVYDNEIAYSFFDIKIENTKYPEKLDKPYSNKILKALENGWDGFKSFIIILISLWPVIIFIVLLLIVFRYLVKKFIRKFKSK